LANQPAFARKAVAAIKGCTLFCRYAKDAQPETWGYLPFQQNIEFRVSCLIAECFPKIQSP
jgi:hypothetical protein